MKTILAFRWNVRKPGAAGWRDIPVSAFEKRICIRCGSPTRVLQEKLWNLENGDEKVQTLCTFCFEFEPWHPDDDPGTGGAFNRAPVRRVVKT